MRNHQPMGCGEARTWLSPEPHIPAIPNVLDQQRALEHLDGCRACSEYMNLDPLLREAYARLGRVQAPERVHSWVRGALAASVAEEQRIVHGIGNGRGYVSALPEREARSSVLQSMVAGVLLAAALMAGLGTMKGEPPVLADSAFMEDYMRRATAGERIATTDPQEVTEFFAERLGFELVPLQGEGLTIEAAEVCFLDGELGALIIYKIRGEVLTHYIIPKARTDPRPPRSSTNFRDQDGMVVAGRDGEGPGRVNLVTWATRDLEQALVSPLPARALVGLASS